MKVSFWGTRGSLASPGAATARYGGNTSCVTVEGHDGSVVVLDAGTGIRPLGESLDGKVRRVDILLTHLHMDHIQGLGFFRPLHDPDVEVHIWGPASATLSLQDRLMRYLSPPLFPVRLRELSCQLTLHEVPAGEFRIGELRVEAEPVCHPGPTVAFRIEEDGRSLAYLPDHEPALGVRGFPGQTDWTSGYRIALGVDLLVHDAQYSEREYPERIGFGHSSIEDALRFARIAEARRVALFHHDPAHTDEDLDELIGEACATTRPDAEVLGAREGEVFRLRAGE